MAAAPPAHDWGSTTQGVDAKILSGNVWPLIPPLAGNLFQDATAREGYRQFTAAFKSFVPPAPEGVTYDEASFSRADVASAELKKLAAEANSGKEQGEGKVYIVRPPQDKANGAGIIFLHGGGFVGGTPQMTDGLLQALAAQTGFTFFAPSYRLFPESGPFPAALLDVWAGLDWIVAHAQDYGVSKDKLGLYGQSAGGWLALTLAAARAELTAEKQSGVKAIFASYPVTSVKVEPHASKKQPEATKSFPPFLWNYESNEEIERNIIPASALSAAPAALRPFAVPDELTDSHLKTLSPLYVVAAERDFLRDEAVAFANKAKQAGTDVTLRVAPGDVHVGLECFALDSPQAAESVGELAKFFLTHLLA